MVSASTDRKLLAGCQDDCDGAATASGLSI
jgi:hypothetical protein